MIFVGIFWLIPPKNDILATNINIQELVRNIEYLMEILHNKSNQVLFHVGVIVWKFLIIYKSIMFSSEL